MTRKGSGVRVPHGPLRLSRTDALTNRGDRVGVSHRVSQVVSHSALRSREHAFRGTLAGADGRHHDVAVDGGGGAGRTVAHHVGHVFESHASRREQRHRGMAELVWMPAPEAQALGQSREVSGQPRVLDGPSVPGGEDQVAVAPAVACPGSFARLALAPSLQCRDDWRGKRNPTVRLSGLQLAPSRCRAGRV